MTHYIIYMDSLAHLENSKLKFKKEICWFSWDSSYRINRMGELGWSSETGDNRKTKRSFGSPSFVLERHMDGASKVSDSSTCSWWFCKIHVDFVPPIYITKPFTFHFYFNHAGNKKKKMVKVISICTIHQIVIPSICDIFILWKN